MQEMSVTDRYAAFHHVLLSGALDCSKLALIRCVYLNNGNIDWINDERRRVAVRSFSRYRMFLTLMCCFYVIVFYLHFIPSFTVRCCSVS